MDFGKIIFYIIFFGAIAILLNAYSSSDPFELPSEDCVPIQTVEGVECV